MNTFTELQEKGIKVGQKFNLLEVGLFETYLMVGGLFLVFLFPALLKIHILIYIIIFCLGIAYTLKEYITKNKDFEKRWKMKGWHIHLLREFSYLDFAIYKTTIFVFGIILAKLFPGLLHINLMIIWVLIFGFGMGYFIAKITKKEKKGFFGR